MISNRKIHQIQCIFNQNIFRLVSPIFEKSEITPINPHLPITL